ncbi:MAG: ABC transporter ATP-binding protein [Clostridia bacterium]|nr:ABC transporter ATP-binding protein [Clostridia bacterium]
MLKRLARCVREYKRPTMLTLLFIVCESIIETVIPYVTATYLINEIQKKGRAVDVGYLWMIGGILAALALLSLACGGLAGFTCARASAGFAKNLRHDVFSHIQDFTFSNIDRFSSASLVTRLTSDVSNVQMSFMMIIRTAVRAPLMLIFAVIMAASMGGWLALTFAFVIPLLVVGLYLIARFAMPTFRRVFNRYDRLNASVEENVRGVRVVKGFSRQEYEKEKFAVESDAIGRDFTRAERIVAVNTPLMNFCMYFNMIFILSVGAMLAIRGIGGVNIGHISALLTYGMQILMSLMMLSMIYVILTISAESAKRICQVLDEAPDMPLSDHPVTEVPDGSVDFEGVSFKYSAKAENDALSGVDLHISSGMTVGILGVTGSSKSTLVQLIPRLYDATEGVVRVGGVDVRDYDLDTLRHAVSMVLQKNLLFAGTIKENLRWGNPDATDEQIREACRIACADEFIDTFPDGYDTHIEQGGANVSGGQRQRLCIARALLAAPRVLILDDSTSAVDTRTDASIRAGLRACLPDATKIIIAQRVASVSDADLILVMEQGRIIARGTHEQLLASSEIYREIYRQQTGGAEKEQEKEPAPDQDTTADREQTGGADDEQKA